MVVDRGRGTVLCLFHRPVRCTRSDGKEERDLKSRAIERKSREHLFCAARERGKGLSQIFPSNCTRLRVLWWLLSFSFFLVHDFATNSKVKSRMKRRNKDYLRINTYFFIPFVFLLRDIEASRFDRLTLRAREINRVAIVSELTREKCRAI